MNVSTTIRGKAAETGQQVAAVLLVGPVVEGNETQEQLRERFQDGKGTVNQPVSKPESKRSCEVSSRRRNGCPLSERGEWAHSPLSVIRLISALNRLEGHVGGVCETGEAAEQGGARARHEAHKEHTRRPQRHVLLGHMDRSFQGVQRRKFIQLLL
jgi:hypothetical protein